MAPADRGEVPTMFGAVSSTDDPHAALDVLISVYPAAEADILHPADVAFFELCAPRQAVNFVPVIDKDVRRWWRSDSLWQAHARYSADEVCIIPGPVAVAGITRVDEPVGELLDRFEAQVTAELAAAGGQPIPVDGRKRAGVISGEGAVAAILEADDVEWAGRIVPNPATVIGDRGRWVVVDPDRAEHAPTGAVLERAGSGRFDLVVPVSAPPSASCCMPPRRSPTVAAR